MGKKLGIAYSEKLRDEIAQLIAQGYSMKSIGKMDNMPEFSTLWKWRQDYEDFNRAYWIAKQWCADIYAEEIIEIADDASEDFKPGKDGDLVFSNDNINRAKLKIDARKWASAKLMPKRYSDRVQQELFGKDGGEIETKATINFIPASKAFGSD